MFFFAFLCFLLLCYFAETVNLSTLEDMTINDSSNHHLLTGPIELLKQLLLQFVNVPNGRSGVLNALNWLD